MVVTLGASVCDLTVTATWPRPKRDQYSIDFLLFDRAHPNDNSHQYALPVTATQTTESHTFNLTSGASTTWFASAVLGSTTSGALAFANSAEMTVSCVLTPEVGLRRRTPGQAKRVRARRAPSRQAYRPHAPTFHTATMQGREVGWLHQTCFLSRPGDSKSPLRPSCSEWFPLDGGGAGTCFPGPVPSF
jgi:hypothetical protein